MSSIPGAHLVVRDVNINCHGIVGPGCAVHAASRRVRPRPAVVVAIKDFVEGDGIGERRVRDKGRDHHLSGGEVRRGIVAVQVVVIPANRDGRRSDRRGTSGSQRPHVGSSAESAHVIGSQTNDVSTHSGRTHVRTLASTSSPTVTAPTVTIGGDNYDLDRNDTTADFTTGQMVVTAFIPHASLSDAIALNKILDGDDNSGTGADTAGRCMYSAAGADNTVTIYVYVAHY